MDMKQALWPGWETVQLIGRGSYGTVYEIERKLFEDDQPEKAAMKVISIPQNDGDIEEMYSDGYDGESVTSTFDAYLKSIVAEYSLVRKMNGHTNIVNCDDIRYIQHDDGIGWDIYIKMELLTPLIKMLPSSIPDDFVIKMAWDICAALKLCKNHNIIHRDIKPQNIFVSQTGDFKLGDFGIAKTCEKTTGGTKIGTYKYMAPEIYNNKPYGFSVDVYSLGLVMYWMLNERRMPFLPLPPKRLTTDMDETARQRRFAGEPLPAPKNGSDALKAIVLKACAYESKDRYQSANEMMQALEALRGRKEGYFVSDPPKDEDKTIGMWSTMKAESEGQYNKIVDAADRCFQEGRGENNKHEAVEVKSVRKSTDEKQTQQKTKIRILSYILLIIIILVLCIALIANLKCNHNWVKATCINPQFCEKCGDVMGNTIAHTWIEATSSAPKTCAVCGLTEGSALTIDDTPAPTTAPPDTEPTVVTEETTTPETKHADLIEKIKNTNLAHKPKSLYDEPVAYTVLPKTGVIRRGCGTEYKKVGTVRKGETVYVYATRYKWRFIQTENGKIGWVNFKMEKKDG